MSKVEDDENTNDNESSKQPSSSWSSSSSALAKEKFATARHSEHQTGTPGTPEDDEDDHDHRSQVKNEQSDEAGVDNNNVTTGSADGRFVDDDSSRDYGGGGGEGEGPNNNNKFAFPILLHEVVSNPQTNFCIHWLPCGTRFMISDKKIFAENVLPLFCGNAKYTSFTRRLKRWGFRRVPSGPYMGTYYSPNFTRDHPDLAASVRYDHPRSSSGGGLSGAAMRLSKAKKLQLQLAGMGMGDGMTGMGMGGVTGPISALGLAGLGAAAFSMNPQQLFGSAASMPSLFSNEEKEVLLRQMSLMNVAAFSSAAAAGGGGGGVTPPGMGMHMNMGGGSTSNPNLEQLYLAAMNQQNTALSSNMAAMMFERLNKQQQQYPPAPLPQEMSIPNQVLQQQLAALAAQQAQAAGGGGSFPVNFMPSSLAVSLASATHPVAGLSGFKFAAAGGGVGGDSSSDNPLLAQQQQQQQFNSSAMNALPGGNWGEINGPSASPNPAASLLHFNSPSLGGASAPEIGGGQQQQQQQLGGGGGQGGTTPTSAAAFTSSNSRMMNTLLAEYLSRATANNINNGNGENDQIIAAANGVGGSVKQDVEERAIL